jgi:CheY-like chemotaxis protein
MGGQIWFETEAGVGSNFQFFVVAAEGQPDEKNQTRNPLGDFDSDFSKRYPLKVLLVEDNRTNQIVALGLLERLGYKADVANEGYEALRKTEQKNYDLILMDCHMPGMDGFEATRQIRKRHEGARGPRIVALTASLSEEDMNNCRSSGMDGYLGKPIVVAELVSILADSSPKDQVAAKPTSGANFDRAKYESNFVGMEDLATATVESFLEQQVHLLSAIEDALLVKDSKALELSAHTLKGAVSNFFAEPTRLRAAKLEELGRLGQWDKTEEIHLELKAEAEKLNSDLHEFVRAKKVA